MIVSKLAAGQSDRLNPCLRGWIAVATMALLVLGGVTQSAVAQGRGIGIGIGVVTGLSVLKGLGAGKGKTYSNKKQRADSDEGTHRRTRRATRKSRDEDDDDDDDKVAKKEKRKEKSKEQEHDDGSVARDGSDSGTSSLAQPARVEEEGAKAAAREAPGGPETGAIGAGPAAIPPGLAAGGSSGPVKLISTTAEITAAQEHLRYLGYDVATASGQVDLTTKIAIMKFQDSLGAPTTGELTVEQLQRLFVMAAEKSAHK